MLERLRRLWWLELLIVVIALLAISRIGNPGREPQPSPDSGRPLVLHFMVLDRQQKPVAGARVQVWHPDSAPEVPPRAFEGTLVTSMDGEATLYSVMPSPQDRRVLYAIETPSGQACEGVLSLPERPGTRSYQPPHVLSVEEARNGLMWRAEILVTLP